MTKFKDMKLSKDLLSAIDRLGFEEATEIQEKSIPNIIEGKGVIGESATGSGKTLAFGCGVFEKTRHKSGLQSLILTPTRELAEQVKDSIKNLTKGKNLTIITIYGGVAINPQIRNLPHADVVVATPGRLLDHMERRTINLSKVKLLILDEADRMLDMGFIRDVESIVRECPKNRQTLFFSATISPEIERLADRYVKDPVKIAAANQVDPKKLKQVYYNVPKHMKLSLLAQLLEEEKSKLVLIFCNTRRNTDFVTKHLRKNGIEATAIHGGLSQYKRSSTLKSFNENKMAALVCTDVAARGLDIGNVSHVYNYDLPDDPTNYIHRIGRTARAGKEGKVINLIANHDHPNFSQVLKNYRAVRIEKLDTPKITKVIVVKSEPRNNRSSRRSPLQGRWNNNNSRSGGRSFGGSRSGGRGFGTSGDKWERRPSRGSSGPRSPSRGSGPRGPPRTKRFGKDAGSISHKTPRKSESDSNPRTEKPKSRYAGKKVNKHPKKRVIKRSKRKD
jgi:superfamily II DNA/RNA helicase